MIDFILNNIIKNRILIAIENRIKNKQKKIPGPLGQFYRNGGNDQLYDIPVQTGELIIDAGSYQGEWTAKMIIRYGCRSECFEPVIAYAENCKRLFLKNTMVRVNSCALGASNQVADFNLSSNGTSQFRDNFSGETFKAKVIDISEFLKTLDDETIACLKLNIEGGEYDVLERLIEANQLGRFRSLLIQFHRQPNGWENRRNEIRRAIKLTHDQEWCYPMVWEKWVKR